jgi:hypothetical protein
MNSSAIVIIEDKCLDYMLNKGFSKEDNIFNAGKILDADKNHRR